MTSLREAKRLAAEMLEAENLDGVAAGKYSRDKRWSIWVFDYRDASDWKKVVMPDSRIIVTDAGEAEMTGARQVDIDEAMERLGYTLPAADTDEESLVLLADVDPEEAAELRALKEQRRRE